MFLFYGLVFLVAFNFFVDVPELVAIVSASAMDMVVLCSKGEKSASEQLL